MAKDSLVLAGATGALLSSNGEQEVGMPGNPHLWIADVNLSDGTTTMRKQIDFSLGDVFVARVGADGAGNAYVVGVMQGGAKLSAEETVLPRFGTRDYFVTKVAPDGAILWFEAF